MIKLFTTFVVLIFVGSAAMANAMGDNSPRKGSVHVRFGNVCGRGETHLEAQNELVKLLNSKIIGLNTGIIDNEWSYRTHLKGPFNLPPNIFYTTISWGKYKYAACGLVQGEAPAGQ